MAGLLAACRRRRCSAYLWVRLRSPPWQTTRILDHGQLNLIGYRYAGNVVPSEWTTTIVKGARVKNERAESFETDRNIRFTRSVSTPQSRFEISWRGHIRNSYWGSVVSVTLASESGGFVSLQHRNEEYDHGNRNMVLLSTPGHSGEFDPDRVEYRERFPVFLHELTLDGNTAWMRVTDESTGDVVAELTRTDLPLHAMDITSITAMSYHTTGSGTTWIDDVQITMTAAQEPDGACDAGDYVGSPDCDGVCDAGDAADGADCDGVCDALDSPGSPDCDGVCDAGDDAGSADCDDNWLCANFEGADCDDGDACTTGETCQSGACVGGAEITCDDANACTDDSCDPASGCVYSNNDANDCSDADLCDDEVCVSGACVSAAVDCDDGVSCTNDACVPATGCVHAPDDSSCAVPGGDACTFGTCSPSVGDPVTGCIVTTQSDGYVVQPNVPCGAEACGLATGDVVCQGGAEASTCDPAYGVVTGLGDTGCVSLDVVYILVQDASGADVGTLRCFRDANATTDQVRCDETAAGSGVLKVYDGLACPSQVYKVKSEWS